MPAASAVPSGVSGAPSGAKSNATAASVKASSLHPSMAQSSASASAAAPPGSEAGIKHEDENIAEFALEAQPPEIQHLFQAIDSHREQYIATLRDIVAIRSISSWSEARAEVLRMTQWFGAKLKELGANVEVRKMGEQTVKGEGEGNDITLPIPPVLFASIGEDPAKRTLLIYGHVDVLPARREDGWEGEPFLLNDFHGQLQGRGATDNKGPLLGWIHAIQAYQENEVQLPVNIKFILEGMEECGSEGLAQLLAQQKDQFLANVDFICISDNYWLGKTKPCLTYGLRGLCYFLVQVEAGSKDLHSGVFGGNVFEALPDLIYLLNQLVDHEGNILVPDIMNDVCEKTIAEEELYAGIDFNLEEYKDDMGVLQLRHPNDKVRTLMNKWRYPSLSIHGIQGAFHDPGARCVIPRKVIGKFSIRIVPNQTPEAVAAAVTKYMNQKWEERGSPNKFLCFTGNDGIVPWLADPTEPAYRAARRAIATAYQTFPDMIREGGYMPSVLMLSQVTEKSVVLLPMGSSDDAAHYKNEKIDTSNFIEGTKVMAAYFWELAKLKDIGPAAQPSVAPSQATASAAPSHSQAPDASVVSASGAVPASSLAPVLQASIKPSAISEPQARATKTMQG